MITTDLNARLSDNSPASLAAAAVPAIITKLNALPIFYCDAMVAESESFSPSAAKPLAVVASWRKLGVALNIRAPEAITVKELSTVHDSRYVVDVVDCRQSNGFGNRSPAVARSLFYTNGAMLHAAREALSNRKVAIAPCSGFHHAAFDHGGGFCTFNGLMVTTKVLLDEGKVSRVGILDFDQHWGDGTHDIIRRLGLKNCVRHYHPFGCNAVQFTSDLPGIIKEFADCDLVLYQAGADPHIDDPLGGWLTTKQLQTRDRLVFKELKRLRIPVAWNLAGGYQRDDEGSIRPILVVRLTLLASLRGYKAQVAVEFGRQGVPAKVKPTSKQLEEFFLAINNRAKVDWRIALDDFFDSIGAERT